MLFHKGFNSTVLYRIEKWPPNSCWFYRSIYLPFDTWYTSRWLVSRSSNIQLLKLMFLTFRNVKLGVTLLKTFFLLGFASLNSMCYTYIQNIQRCLQCTYVHQRIIKNVFVLREKMGPPINSSFAIFKAQFIKQFS